MSKYLVVVESPAKAKTINKILGRDYTVRASLGHVRDLPQKTLAVDVENGFEPSYQLIPGRKKTVSELQSAAKDAEKIFLAPDPDREGEAIAWHLQHALAGRKKMDDRFYRVTYNEITATAIRRAFEHPTRLNMHRVDAQQARRVLDRLVGYQVSPLLWRRIRGGSSAGRVQSVALRLICAREAEVRSFQPEEYWVFGARVNKQVPPVDVFVIRLAKINGQDPAIQHQADAAEVRQDLEQRALVVRDIQEREVTRKTRPPFITSTLQQSASSALHFTPARSMSVAQKLYEGVDFGEGSVGLITYMRTDAPTVSREAQEACRAYVAAHFGPDYVPEQPNFFKGRASAQEAHEAIRPTDVQRTPEAMAAHLKPEELKLYRLIWQRFVASQMAPAKIAQRTVEVAAEPVEGRPARAGFDYVFRATVSEIKFPGFMKATGEDLKKAGAPKKKAEDGADAEGEEDEDSGTLPPLTVGEGLECQEWLSDQKFTKPPSRFSEASLVRTLEENGVGRPSTYAQIIQTLYTRKYIEKEKGSLRPTDPGEQVCAFLVEHLNALFDVQFTAELEKKLDDIEDGKVEWRDMMASFYATFQQWVQEAKGPAADKQVATRLLDLVEQVQTWAAPVTRGKRTYSDEAFVTSVRQQLNDDKKAISMRQVEALLKLVFKYRTQLPDPTAIAQELGLSDLYQKISAPQEPPRTSTLEKLEVLKAVQFEEPRTVEKRVYDDQAFCGSLREQVEGGKRLSFNQVKYLDRLVQKYAAQIPDIDVRSKEWGVQQEQAVPPERIEPLLAQLSVVTEWKPPVKRGKREWSDEEFYRSLAKQFKEKHTLSPRQFSALGKMAVRYSKGGAAKSKKGEPAAEA